MLPGQRRVRIADPDAITLDRRRDIDVGVGVGGTGLDVDRVPEVGRNRSLVAMAILGAEVLVDDFADRYSVVADRLHRNDLGFEALRKVAATDDADQRQQGYPDNNNRHDDMTPHTHLSQHRIIVPVSTCKKRDLPFISPINYLTRN